MSGFRAALADAEAARHEVFSVRARRAMLIVSIVSLLATTVGILYGQKLQPGTKSYPDSYSKGALGHHAFAELFRTSGYGVARWTEPTHAQVRVPLFMLEPSAPAIKVEDNNVDLAAILRDREREGRKTIIVLPKWKIGDDGTAELLPVHVSEDILSVVPISLEFISDDNLAWQTSQASMSGQSYSISVRAPQRVRGGVPILSDDLGDLVVANESRSVFIVAEPDLLHNFSFDRADHAEFLFDWIESEFPGRSFVLDEVFHGNAKTRSIGRLLGEFPGILLLLQATFLAIVLVWMGGVRFGPPLRTVAPYGQGPEEVIAVSASVLAHGTKAPRLARRYVEALIGRLSRKLGSSEGNVDQRAANLDKIIEARGLKPLAQKLLGEARAAEKPEQAREVVHRAYAFQRTLLARQPRTSQKTSRTDPRHDSSTESGTAT